MTCQWIFVTHAIPHARRIIIDCLRRRKKKKKINEMKEFSIGFKRTVCCSDKPFPCYYVGCDCFYVHDATFFDGNSLKKSALNVGCPFIFTSCLSLLSRIELLHIRIPLFLIVQSNVHSDYMHSALLALLTQPRQHTFIRCASRAKTIRSSFRSVHDSNRNFLLKNWFRCFSSHFDVRRYFSAAIGQPVQITTKIENNISMQNEFTIDKLASHICTTVSQAHLFSDRNRHICTNWNVTNHNERRENNIWARLSKKTITKIVISEFRRDVMCRNSNIMSVKHVRRELLIQLAW